jgi:hypothetical protein
MSAETPSIQQQLLDIAHAITTQQPVVCPGGDGRTILWSNITDLHPGLGIDAEFTDSYRLARSRLVAAKLLVLDDRGGTSMIVDRGAHEEDLENEFSRYFLESFRQYDPAMRLSLSGLENVNRIRRVTSIIVPAQIRSRPSLAAS